MPDNRVEQEESGIERSRYCHGPLTRGGFIPFTKISRPSIMRNAGWRGIGSTPRNWKH